MDVWKPVEHGNRYGECPPVSDTRGGLQWSGDWLSNRRTQSMICLNLANYLYRNMWNEFPPPTSSHHIPTGPMLHSTTNCGEGWWKLVLLSPARVARSIEFFLNNMNLTFLALLYKIDITFKIGKNKVASTGNRTHNTNHLWIRILTALTTQPPRHLLNKRALNWTWIISGSIEHDFIRVWKSETSMDWQIGWVGKAVRIRDGWCCEFNSQWRHLYFFWFLNLLMSILYNNARNVRFLLFRKNSSENITPEFRKYNLDF